MPRSVPNSNGPLETSAPSVQSHNTKPLASRCRIIWLADTLTSALLFFKTIIWSRLYRDATFSAWPIDIYALVQQHCKSTDLWPEIKAACKALPNVFAWCVDVCSPCSSSYTADSWPENKAACNALLWYPPAVLTSAPLSSSSWPLIRNHIMKLPVGSCQFSAWFVDVCSIV